VIAADEITNHVLEQLNGKSFYDVAVEELKAKFRQRLYRGAHPKGRTVRLEHFLYLEERYSGNGMRLAYGSSDHWLLLQRILSHFENPSITSALPVITTAMPVPFHHDLDPVRDYDFPNCQRINGATVYKNGNVALKFPTNELALEFCRTVDLTT